MANKKLVYTIYFTLRVLVIVMMVAQFFNGNFENVLLCALTLVLFLLLSVLERSLHIDLPDTLEIVILLFIFAAEILGEIQSFYITFPYWDTMLHTMNGFLCAAIGFALVDLLNRNERVSLNLSPFFMAVVAFCFSMTIGVIWEFFEFFMDHVFLMDMQKAVSYTHLDVYKRQMLYCMINWSALYIMANPTGHTSLGGYTFVRRPVVIHSHSGHTYRDQRFLCCV